MQAEGNLWRAIGVLTAAGALRNAVILLRKEGLPDAAAAYVEAATAAGFGTYSATSESGIVAFPMMPLKASNLVLVGKVRAFAVKSDVQAASLMQEAWKTGTILVQHQ